MLSAILPLLPLFPLLFAPLLLVAFALVLPSTAPRLPLAHRASAALLLLGLVGAVSGIVFRVGAFSEEITSTLPFAVSTSDLLTPRLAAFFRLPLAAGALFLTADSPRTPDTDPRGAREFPLLAILLLAGALLALIFPTINELFLALERATLAAYALVASARRGRFSTYAALQYFLLGAIPSAAFVLAFALLYRHGGVLTLPDFDLLSSSPVAFTLAVGGLSSAVTASGSLVASTTAFDPSSVITAAHDLDAILTTTELTTVSLEDVIAAVSPLTPLVVTAFLLLLTNLLFKLTAAPFHAWAPSVYGKAPLATLPFLTTLPKVRALILLASFLPTIFAPLAPLATPLLSFLALLAIIVGLIGAFSETERKRFLVYASRGHVGFRLLGLSLPHLAGVSATFHYLPIYLLSALASWAFLLSFGRGVATAVPALASLASLAPRDPLFARAFALLLASRRGLPPFGGFFVKLDLFAALLTTGHTFLAAFLFVLTVASAFYYLRVTKVLLFDTTAFANTTASFTPAVAASAASSETELALRNISPRDATLRLAIFSFILITLFTYLLVVQSPLLGVLSDLLSARGTL